MLLHSIYAACVISFVHHITGTLFRCEYLIRPLRNEVKDAVIIARSKIAGKLNAFFIILQIH